MTSTERNERIAVKVLGWKTLKSKGKYFRVCDLPGVHYDPIPNFISDDSTMARLVEAVSKKYDVMFRSSDKHAICRITEKGDNDSLWDAFVKGNCHAALIAAIEQMIEEGE